MDLFDVVVVGAGTFGSWIAWHLRRAGRRVALLDAYGPGNGRASSGGETRLIRLGYGADELYTRWALRSLASWKDLAAASGRELFHATGILWMARDDDPLSAATLETLSRVGVPHEKVSRADLERRWPQIDFGPVTWGIHEPENGVLMARRAVRAAADRAVRDGVSLVPAAVRPLREATGRLDSLMLSDGTAMPADVFVFACGPWLPKIFPGLLGRRIFPTRQEVFYLGPPAGDPRFGPPAMPAWVDFSDGIYGVPDIDGKGVKIAFDRHGPRFDPDSGDRRVTAKGLAAVRAFVSRRFPALAGAPLVGSEVCQYENTSNGDFLIDRHPDVENVWIAGGGSGHGFKHGPAVGEYVAALISEGGPVEERFSLATKRKKQSRTVF